MILSKGSKTVAVLSSGYGLSPSAYTIIDKNLIIQLVSANSGYN